MATICIAAFDPRCIAAFVYITQCLHTLQSNQVKNQEEHLMHRRLADLKHSLQSQLHRVERQVMQHR